MGGMTKAEQDKFVEAEADLLYWQEVCKYIPEWRVFGWTYRNNVTYITPENNGTVGGWDMLVRMTGKQRDELVAAFERLH